ncbi:MAG: YciI family protein [Gemmatales bacterium]
MNYAVLYEYSPDKEKIAAHRPAHREHLKYLLDNGQLLAAGPITDDSAR